MTDPSATVEATSGWLTALTALVDAVDGWVWGLPLISAILLTGMLLTCILRFRHLVNLKHAFQCMFGRAGRRRRLQRPHGVSEPGRPRPALARRLAHDEGIILIGALARGDGFVVQYTSICDCLRRFSLPRVFSN